MEEKIYQALLQKLGKTSLSERTIRAKAARMLKKITKDDEMTDDVITDAVGDLKDIEGQLNHDISEKVSETKKNSDEEIKTLKAEIKRLGGNPPAKEGNEEIEKIRAEYDAKFAAYDAKIKEEEKKKKDSEILSKVKELIKTEKYGCANEAVSNIVMRGCIVGDNDTAEMIADRIKKDYDAQCKLLYPDGVTPRGGSSAPKTEFDGKAEVERLRAAGLIPKAE